MGVFATRSPFRPNPIGLSCVRLVEICDTEKEGSVLLVEGVDMMDGTPIYDVKPYLPYVDCKVDAAGGFAEQHKNDGLTVIFDGDLEMRVPEEQRAVLRQILAQDPRPSYQEDPGAYLWYGLCRHADPFSGSGWMSARVQCAIESVGRIMRKKREMQILLIMLLTVALICGCSTKEEQNNEQKVEGVEIEEDADTYRFVDVLGNEYEAELLDVPRLHWI